MRQAERGDVKSALETMKEVSEDAPWVRRQVVEGLARRGSLKQAADLAESTDDLFDRAYAFMAVAAAQANRGDRKAALASRPAASIPCAR